MVAGVVLMPKLGVTGQSQSNPGIGPPVRPLVRVGIVMVHVISRVGGGQGLEEPP
jgi:hypothetical protein